MRTVVVHSGDDPHVRHYLIGVSEWLTSERYIGCRGAPGVLSRAHASQNLGRGILARLPQLHP